MPKFNLKWSHDNGEGEDPTTHTTQTTGSTIDKAIAAAVGLAVQPYEIEGFTLTWEELDEDGNITRTSDTPE